ncbi:hypothetical protein [Teredinibacter haidensis]|uniref:hypothetical protein n=1 Tax=Teredinibacter haidensis TaxID=2731755 RepID=UPI001FEA9124|nr:hypothetical protein [Teredinibacter haidensis]
MALGTILLATTATYLRLIPVSSFLDFSHKIKQTAVVVDEQNQTLRLNVDSALNVLSIEVKAGENYRDRASPFIWGKIITSPPQMVFWLENMENNHIRTLFITAKTGYSFLFPHDPLRTDIVERKESFPYWLHKWQQGNQATKLDALTGATPKGHFTLKARLPQSLRRFQVLAEINRSFDYNRYYTKDRYPEDPIYSGSGNPAQPSIIYQTTIDLDSEHLVFVMKPIGHGHHSGNDGNLYTDMQGIDSALHIIRRIIVEIDNLN